LERSFTPDSGGFKANRDDSQLLEDALAEFKAKVDARRAARAA